MAGSGTQNDGNSTGPLSWVLNEDDFAALLEAIATSEHMIIDLETTGLREKAYTKGPMNGGVAARVALAAITLPQRSSMDLEEPWDGSDPTTYVVPLSHPKSPFVGVWRRQLARILQQAIDFSRPISNQHMKFDAKWIYATTGVDVSDFISWDTQIGAHLLDETQSTSLKEIAPRHFGIDRWDDVDLTYPGAAEEVDLFQLGEYAARDTYWTWKEMLYQKRLMFLDNPEGHHPEDREETENARLGKLAVWVAMPMVNSLTKIEQNGFRLDVPWVEEHLESDRKVAKESLDAMAERYGMDRKGASLHATSTWFKEFTQRAVERDELQIMSMTGSGNPQWSKGVLNRNVRYGSEVAKLILDGRQASKRAEYLHSWLQHVSTDGFIHTTYWPGRVVTGRLSSEAPNMQQVTRSLKPAFIARDGHYVVELDYSQIELRVAAHIANEQNMIEAFKNGDDLHRLFAARISGKNPEDVEPDERQRAKAGNFGLLYMMSAYGFMYYAEDAYGVVLTENEAVETHAKFFQMWPGIKTWHQSSIGKIHRDGQITSPLGRVRRLPGVWDANPKMVSYAERAGINAPVQGMASDFMQTAAASIQGYTPGSLAIPRQRLVGTVHDSIIGEVPIDSWQDTVGEMQERMVNLTSTLKKMGVDFKVPLVADATVGTRWGTGDVSK